MPTTEGAGVELAYEQRGAGATLLLLHDIAGDAQAMAPLARELEQDATVIAYDRRGYGGSGAPDAYRATTVAEQAEDAAALLGGLDAAPAVLLGEGFGALIALDLAKRHRALVRALVLVDPPLLSLVAHATEALAEQRERLERALREGGPAAAVDEWLGPDADEAHRRRAHAAYRAFFADYAGIASWPVTRAELRAIDMPAVVLTSGRTPAPIAAAADALARLLGNARREHEAAPAAVARSLLG